VLSSDTTVPGFTVAGDDEATATGGKLLMLARLIVAVSSVAGAAAIGSRDGQPDDHLGGVSAVMWGR
jgi:hypothetical protein